MRECSGGVGNVNSIAFHFSQIVKRDHFDFGMVGQIFRGVMEEIYERLIGMAVAEVFPPMGDKHG